VSGELRRLLAAEAAGVLATRSVHRADWPFGSVVAYAVGTTGEPLLLLSQLAEHTRNIAADPRVSLLVQDRAAVEDPLAGARVTLLGAVVPVAFEQLDRELPRYLTRHPAAGEYLALGDFQLFRLTVVEARYIGGFGDMGWLADAALTAELYPDEDAPVA
jgi:putative heme iron utilization protein